MLLWNTAVILPANKVAIITNDKMIEKMKQIANKTHKINISNTAKAFLKRFQELLDQEEATGTFATNMKVFQ